MTINDKIVTFINRATSKARAIAVVLVDLYDRDGYQSTDSKDALLMLYELRMFSKLLLTSDRGGLTDRQVNDTIDFFWEWCELSKLSVVQYTNYQSIIEEGSQSGSGSFASQSALNAEIQSRITNDLALSNRISVLEASQPDPTTFFPAGFFDNLNATYAVVFDDDPRLHTHNNKSILDAINSTLLSALQSLVAHYASIGEPNGVHVSSGDRTAWNAKVTQSQLSNLSNVYAAKNHGHAISEIEGLEDVINSINTDITNMAGADGRDVEMQSVSGDIQWRLVGDPNWISLGNFKGEKGDTGDPFKIKARGLAVNRLSAAYDSADADFTYLEEDTGYLYYRNPQGGSAAIPDGWNNGIKFLGNNGWSPLLAVVEVSSQRSIFEIVDWVGGEGSKPVFNAGNNAPNPIRWFIGPSGITLLMSQATNIKGPTGNGTPPIVNAVGNIAGRSLYDDKPAGFIYMRTDVSPRTIFQKISDAAGDWGPELPWQGPPGDGGSGGSSLLTQDIPVINTTLGKYKDGDIIPAAGKIVQDVLLDIANKYKDPAFTALALKLADGTTAQPLTVERGYILTGAKVITWLIDLGSGAVGALDIVDVTANVILKLNTPNDGSESFTVNTVQLNSDGATQQFKLVAHDTNKPGDVPSAIITITARLPIFQGPIAARPTNSATVRAMPVSLLRNGGGSAILNTGTTLTKFGIWLPLTNTLTNVTDLDASNANITSDYAFIGTITILDAGGNSMIGNYYEANGAIPFSSNHRHQFSYT